MFFKQKPLKLPQWWYIYAMGQSLVHGCWTAIAYNIDTHKYVAIPESEEQLTIEDTYKLLNQKIERKEWFNPEQ